MENYYFHDGDQQFGPFSLADFQRQPLTSTTSVWKEGMTAWIPAHAMPELRGIVPPAPPPAPTPSNTPQMQRSPEPAMMKGSTDAATMERLRATQKGGVTAKDWVIWGAIALLVFCIGYYYSIPHPGRSGFASSVVSAVDQERVNPMAFFRAVGGTYKPNFWQTKWEIAGSVSNVANHTNYKDVIIQVSFMSRTNSVIDTKRFVLYDYFPYGLKKGFNLEVEKPAAAASCGWQVVGASFY
jgi:hypothetical protein